MKREWKVRRVLVLLITACTFLCIFVYIFWNGFTYSEVQMRQAGQRAMSQQTNSTINVPHIRSRTLPSGGGKTKMLRHLPVALIAGVAKSGTATFETFLAHHPDVQGMGGAEICFFKLNHLYRKGREHYRSLMPPGPPGTVQIERSSNYFQDHVVPGRVFEFNNTMKVIFILKEPSSRVLSQYVHNTIRNVTPERTNTFEQLVFKDNAAWEVNTKYDAVDTSIYDKHVQKWREYFPLSQLLFVDGDEFIRDPYPHIKQAESFLRLPPFFTREQFVFNREKGFYCFENSDSRELSCMGKDKGRTHPNISGTLMKRLRTFYQPHNDRLLQLTGKLFSWVD